jgi:prepilin-type N-terminal cleavage/methylation domain-containing protein
MRRRPAFTLVEMLVALALILLIMVILTEAFSAGLESFRRLKAIGDMQERLRSAALILRDDLRADHFEETRGNRLSDQDLRSQPPPHTGYFRIAQRFPLAPDPAAPYPAVPPPFTPYYQGSVWEGADADNIPSTRAAESWLAFTVHLHGTRPADYRTGGVPGPGLPGHDADAYAALQGEGPADFRQPGTVLSQWAEVAYFLRPLAGDAGSPVTANGTPLYGLYRRQRLLGPNAAPGIPASAWAHYYDLSFPQPAPGSARVSLNTPVSITRLPNRVGMDPVRPEGLPSKAPPPAPATGVWTLRELLGGPNAPQAGDDLLLTDVLSFDVKVLQEGGAYNGPYDGGLVPAFVDLPAPARGRNATFRAANVSVFDTWSEQGAYGDATDGWDGTNASSPRRLPLKMRILAIQVTVRVWDGKSEQARQLSIVQDL